MFFTHLRPLFQSETLSEVNLVSIVHFFHSSHFDPPWCLSNGFHEFYFTSVGLSSMSMQKYSN